MHLLALLSAIVALSLTPLVVGLPHPQGEEQQQQQQSNSNSLDKVAGFLGAVGLGAGGASLFNWNNQRTNSRKLKDLQNGQTQNAQKLDELRQSQAATQKQLGDHTSDTRAGFERVNGQLSRISTQNPVSAGQRNASPGKNRKVDVLYNYWFAEIFKRNYDLEKCIIDNIPEEEIFTLFETPLGGKSGVTLKTWNAAVNNCQRVKGWVPELVADEQEWEGWWFGVRVPYKESRQHVSEGPQTPMQFSVNNLKGAVVDGLRGGIARAFKSEQRIPTLGMGRRTGIGQGMPLRGARLGM